MRRVKRIIIHCSDSDFGNSQLIDDLHTGRANPLIALAWPQGTDTYFTHPFRKIGYHYVILNGFTQPEEYQPEQDGVIEPGRDEEEEGAHCYGYNQDSLGICLIGKRLFSGQQLYLALPGLINQLCHRYSLSGGDIYGHYEFNQNKSCPNIDIKLIRNILKSW